MKRFVKVQGVGQYADYDVPTKEEYEDCCGKVSKRLGELQARITTLECRIANVGEIKMFDFGTAIAALKRGKAVARKGWNGKGMFLTLQNGSEVEGSLMRNEPAKNYYGDNKVKICPHIDMKAADGTYVVGWVASQTDMLAEDWEIIE